MLFNSSIRKELAQTFAAILTVLLTIVITVMLIRTLSMASKGAVAPQDVMLVLAYVMLGYIPILLSLTLFLTIVFVLGRMYRDSEMVIWQGAGAGTLKLFNPILGFSWPILAGIAILMLFVWPWSNSQIASIGEQFQQRSEIAHIQPGQFILSRNNKRVAFIESKENSTDQNNTEYPEGKNAFLLTNDFEAAKQTILTAQSTHVVTEGKHKFLVFENGQQLEFDLAQKMTSLLNFERYTVLVSDTQEIISSTQKAKETPTEQLLLEPTPSNQGELSWRLGLIFSAINFILLAIPLGYANPRVGRNTNMLYAILTFIIYLNLINLGRNWISSEKFSFLFVILFTHGGMFATGIFFLLKRHYEWRVLPNFSFLKKKDVPTKHANNTDEKIKKIQVKKLEPVKHKAAWGRLPTVRKLFYSEITSAIFLVALGFLSLFFFFDIVDEVGDMGRKGYSFYLVLMRCLLQLPMHLYELTPIVILIGTIFVLARMAQNSEFTILRTSGLSPSLALRILVIVGLMGAAATFVIGDILIPSANKISNQLMESFNVEKGTFASKHVAWLRDHDDEYTYTVNLYQVNSTDLKLVNIYIFDESNQLTQWISAPSAQIKADGTWILKNTSRSTLLDIGTPNARILKENKGEMVWKNNLNANVVSIATNKETGLDLLSLYRFIDHLNQNAQTSATYLFSFWQKILYPFSCLVMVMLALPFAYLHFRSGGISTKIFAGVMIGITFIVINNMFGHFGQLRQWLPIVSAGVPSLIYLILSFSVFSWLVKNR